MKMSPPVAWSHEKRSSASSGLPDLVFRRGALDDIRKLPDSVREAVANTIDRVGLESRAVGAPLLGRLGADGRLGLGTTESSTRSKVDTSRRRLSSGPSVIERSLTDDASGA